MPEDYYKSIEDIEADTKVSTKAVGNDLQQHFNSKQSAEEHVAVLQNLSQRWRLQTTIYMSVSNHTQFSRAYRLQSRVACTMHRKRCLYTMLEGRFERNNDMRKAKNNDAAVDDGKRRRKLPKLTATGTRH